MISTLVPQLEQPSQNDMKSKTDVVKFGWIVGVLVCAIVRREKIFSIQNFHFDRFDVY
jgi:hypothetical protein